MEIYFLEMYITVLLYLSTVGNQNDACVDIAATHDDCVFTYLEELLYTKGT